MIVYLFSFTMHEFWMIIRSFLYFFTIVRTGTISNEKVSIIDSLNNKISFYLDEYHLYFSLQVKYLGGSILLKINCSVIDLLFGPKYYYCVFLVQNCSTCIKIPKYLHSVSQWSVT